MAQKIFKVKYTYSSRDDIHMMSSQSYLLFFVIDERKQEVTILRVLQDGQDWKYIIEKWLGNSLK